MWGLVLKIATISVCAALVLGGCTGPGLEPPFDGQDGGLSGEPNAFGNGTSGDNGTDAGPELPDAQMDADAGAGDE